MPGLLDLSDEIIQQIAYWVNDDTYHPLPSFHQHWANFPLDLDNYHNDNITQFRATCRRLRNICRLEGLKVTINHNTEIRRWSYKAPQTVVKAVNNPTSEIEKSNSPTAFKDYDIVSIWSTLVFFLSKFTSLEELILVQTPLCHHWFEDGVSPPSTRQLKIPSFDYLPKLKSLSIQTDCRYCCEYLPRLFIPAAPQLAHLKMPCPENTHTMLERVIKAWSDRHPKKRFRLRTLYYRLHGPFDLQAELDEISVVCPFIEDICFGTFKEGTGDRIAEPILVARQHTSQDSSDWLFYWYDPSNSPLTRVLPKSIEEWQDEDSFEDLVDSVAKYRKLRILDCSMNFRLYNEAEYPSIKMPNNELRKDEYEKMVTKDRKLTDAEAHVNLEDDIREGMKAAAQKFIDEIPTLQQCVFWRPPSSSPYSAKTWYRYTFHRRTNDEGEDIPVMDTYVEGFTDDWLINLDVTKDPIHPLNSDTESEDDD